MISTSTSDYYSSSDLEYDDDINVVEAAPQHHSSTEETNIILQTLFQHQPPSHVSSRITAHHSIRLLKLVRDNDLSDEVFIRASAILHKFLFSTSSNNVDELFLVACLSLATKLTQHSTHFTIALFNSPTLIFNENMICNALDWDIDIITPINYVEAILLHVMDYLVKDRVRKMSYELIVLCLTNTRCLNISAASLGMECLLMACKLLKCCEIVPKQVFKYDEDKDT